MTNESSFQLDDDIMMKLTAVYHLYYHILQSAPTVKNHNAAWERLKTSKYLIEITVTGLYTVWVFLFRNNGCF